MQNYANANAVANNSAAFQPYTGQLVAPFSPLQSQGQQAVVNAPGDPAAANSLASALSGTNGLLGFQAPTIAAPSIAAPSVINPLTVTPSAISPLSVSAASVAPTSITAGQLASTDLTPYLNPYTNDVIDSTLSSLALARDQQQVSDNAAATAAGAFGGTRQAVQNALTTNDYLRNVASTTAGLNQSAYSASVATLLADRWSSVRALPELTKKDPMFERFVLWHVDETMSMEQGNAIRANVRNRCPPGLEGLCKRLEKAAAEPQ